MSEVLLTIAVSVGVTVAITLGPYAWMLLPKYREPKMSYAEHQAMIDKMVKDMRDGMELGLHTDLRPVTKP